MEEKTIAALRAHAEAEYPRESCGLVVVAKGRERYLPCKNAARGTEHFILPAEDFAAADDLGAVIAVVHSHPGVSAQPSQADLVSCESSGLPWHIVRVDLVGDIAQAGELVSIEPKGYRAPLVGRQFAHGVLDCYQLIVDWYKDERSIDLPHFARADGWWDDGTSDLYTAGAPEAGFRRLAEYETPQAGDMILMQIRSANGVPNHAAIYLGDGLMLHHLHGRLSSRDLYAGYYQEVTRAIMRHRLMEA